MLPGDYLERAEQGTRPFVGLRVDDEVAVFEGIPTTTVRRTIEDCHRAHLGPAALRQALDDAQREGHLSPSEVTELSRQILPGRKQGTSR